MGVGLSVAAAVALARVEAAGKGVGWPQPASPASRIKHRPMRQALVEVGQAVALFAWFILIRGHLP